MGAVRPVRRNAPVKVVVFQWPCGTGARQRCPRFARPRGRAILVDAPVDEDQALGIDIRLRVEPGPALRGDVGSILLAGVRGFFDGHVVTVEEAPYRAGCERDAMLATQHIGQLDQCDVHLGIDGS